MSYEKRILTLQIEIFNTEEASWIWENHLKRNYCHGINVTVIQEGSIPKTED